MAPSCVALTAQMHHGLLMVESVKGPTLPLNHPARQAERRLDVVDAAPSSVLTLPTMHTLWLAACGSMLVHRLRPEATQEATLREAHSPPTHPPALAAAMAPSEIFSPFLHWAHTTRRSAAAACACSPQSLAAAGCRVSIVGFQLCVYHSVAGSCNKPSSTRPDLPLPESTRVFVPFLYWSNQSGNWLHTVRFGCTPLESHSHSRRQFLPLR